MLKQEDFIKRSSEVHGNFYIYENVNFTGVDNKVNIICPIHGEFQQRASNHMRGVGCKLCAKEKNKDVKRLSNEDFINKSNEIHNNKYSYEKTKYHNHYGDVIITCPIHGDFHQIAGNHLAGKGCQKCGYVKCNKNRKYPNRKSNKGYKVYSTRIKQEDFIERSNDIHDFYYDYSKVKYETMHDKVIIICPEHGEFEQVPRAHLYLKQGCPKCKRSHGEREICKILKNNNIIFREQERFKECRGRKYPLPFDFYLPELNILIEYQGEQHYKPFRFGNKEKAKSKLQEVKMNDKTKKQFCQNEGITLLEITYKENIKEKLQSYLLQHC